jgi:tetratricopeptide (TPR) repeat protein
MGVVYKARQPKLDRIVALKMIRGGYAGPDELSRFQTEAQAIARLNHPHIVAVYEVGEHHGQPFFSLEFCPGGSLDRRLAGAPLPPREAAALARTLAVAMHAAHSAKIIHRDLKPANILLTADGTPKITDFGLAKKLDEQGQTQSGALMGTPSYMAPEQARALKDIGPPADIYSLGAILYELLTGRPPFRAATTYETLAQVVNEEPVPPRQLNNQVPIDLETITLKCLRKEPAGRYATAQELADDLGRWQRGEPIHARRVGGLERLGKWARRHPAVAALLVLLAVALVGGVTGVTWAWLETADSRNRERAEANRAQQALRTMLANNLADVQLAELLRPTAGSPTTTVKLILKHTQTKYEQALAKVGETPELHEGQGKMLNAIAETYLASDASGEALASARESLAVWQRLREQDETNRDWQAGLALAYQRLGQALSARGGDSRGTLAAYRKAEALRQELVALEPDNPEWQHERANNLVGLALAEKRQGDDELGDRILDESLKIREELASRPDVQPAWKRSLAFCKNQVGQKLFFQGRTEEAHRLYREAYALLLEVTKQNPNNATWQLDLGHVIKNLGYVCEAQKDGERARKLFQESADLAQRFVEKDPTNSLWQNLLLESRMKAEDIVPKPETLTRDDLVRFLEEKQPLLLRDLQAVEQGAARDPENVNHQSRPTLFQRNLALNLTTLAQLGENPRINLEQALHLAQKAIAVRDRLAALDPADVTWAKEAILYRGALTGVYRVQKQEVKALQNESDRFRRQRALALRLLERLPNRRQWQRELVAATKQLALNNLKLAKLGDRPLENRSEAAQLLEEARSRGQRLADEDPKDPHWLSELVDIHALRSSVLADLGKEAQSREADQEHKRCREQLTRLQGKPPQPAAQPARVLPCGLTILSRYLIINEDQVLQQGRILGIAEGNYLRTSAPAQGLAVVTASSQLASLLLALPLRDRQAQARRVLWRGRALLKTLQLNGKLDRKQEHDLTDFDADLKKLGPDPVEETLAAAERQALEEFDLPGLARLLLERNQALDLVRLLDGEARLAREALPAQPLTVQTNWFFQQWHDLAFDPKLVAVLTRTAQEMIQNDPKSLGNEGRQLLASLARYSGDRKTAVVLHPKVLEAGLDRVLTVRIVARLQTARRFGEAALALTETVEQATGKFRVEGYQWLAALHEQAGQIEQAAAAVAVALALEPDNVRTKMLQATVSQAQRRFLQARDQLQEILNQSPAQEVIQSCRIDLAQVHTELGDYDRAEAEVRKVLAVNADLPGALTVLAYLYAAQNKNLPEAEESIRRALQSRPENPAYLSLLGWIRARRGHPKEGLPLMEKAITDEALAHEPELWEHLGDVHQLLGQTDKARACWQKALTLFPSTTDPVDRRKKAVESKGKETAKDRAK